MKSGALKLVPMPADSRADASDPVAQHACIGRVVAVDDGTVPHVDFPRNPHGPLVAKLALSPADADRLTRQWKDTEVLIVFADQDTRQPVITGLVKNSFDVIAREITDWEGFRHLLLRADEELVLQCGEAKIVLRRDGKLTIVGKEILSRAFDRHRIRGATVDIN
jgi:Domain of unknown function (DUF6484)